MAKLKRLETCWRRKAPNRGWPTTSTTASSALSPFSYCRDQSLGVIEMIAVDPDHQLRGTGFTLTNFALNWMRDAGMHVAMVETGGDPGHEPARRLYEATGFRDISPVRYWMSL